MEKNFDIWNSKKKEINIKRAVNLFFNEGDIWSCSLGTNIGFEQDGKGMLFLRPLLIIKKFNKHIFWGLPMTRTHKENKYYHLLLNNPSSKVILSQIRLFDVKRLEYRMGAIGGEEKRLIKEKIRNLLS